MSEQLAALESASHAAGPPSPRSLEQTIGLKWAGWVGAIVLVIGAGLGFKFAYDQGWLETLPPMLRLVAMALAGIALLACGEYVYRRVNVLPAAALFGAGIAILFLASYAGDVFYHIYGFETAIVFAIATTLIGSGVAMRGRLLSTAVIAQLGGQLAPVLLGSGQPVGVPFLGYVGMLQAAALILALWGQTPKWWMLRTLSFVATAFWVVYALAEGTWGAGLRHEVLWFGLLAAGLYQGELLLSGWLAGKDESADADDVPPWRRAVDPRTVVQGSQGTFSLLVTAGFTALAMHVFYADDNVNLRCATTLILAAVAGATAFGTRQSRRWLLRPLAASFAIQCMGLIVLCVVVTLKGPWISLCWGVLSLAYAALGAWYRWNGARLGGFITWMLAILWVVVESVAKPPGEPWFTLVGEPFHAPTVAALLLALAGLGVAWLLQMGTRPAAGEKPSPWGVAGIVLSVFASVVWTLTSLISMPPLGATLLITLWAWLLLLLGTFPTNLGLRPHGFGMLLLATAKWLAIDALWRATGVETRTTSYLPFWNPIFGMGLLLAVSLAASAWQQARLLQRRLDASEAVAGGKDRYALLMVGGCVLLFTLVLSFEVVAAVDFAQEARIGVAWTAFHLKSLSLTMLWAVAALGVGLAARWLRVDTAVPLSLGLVIAGKFLLLDLLAGAVPGASGRAPALVLVNFQVLAACVVLGSLFALLWITPLRALKLRGELALVIATRVLAALMVLIVLTLEIARAFQGPHPFGVSDPAVARQVAISVFWSIFAIGIIVSGFVLRSAWQRYFGLVLFGLTLLKVVMIDMESVEYGYRIVSFVGLGLLLLGTSVLYGKLAPRLLGQAGAPRNGR